MYESHYGFNEKPFNLTPDPKYLYLSARHTEAFAHLEFGRRERGGFIVITGEVGTGKTTLARYFLSRLDSRTATAFVLYPALTGAELLRSILDDFHVSPGGATLKDHVDALHRFLLQARSEGREVVVLIDEAQDLSAEVLEQVRLISNLETDTEKLIQIVLMGQSELREVLARRDLRQLAQRVTARYHLAPLDRAETADYVQHRLTVAGGAGKVSFTAGALGTVHRLSGGVPRLINLICDRALLAGYVQGTRTIDAAMVRRAGREAGPPRPAPSARALAAAGLVAAVAVLAAGALFLPWPSSAGPGTAPAPAPAAAPATTRPAPPAAPGALERLVQRLPREGSLEAALGRVQALWGEGPLQRTSLRTTLGHLRSLDLPAVLEVFHPSRSGVSHLALLRLEGDEAVVAAGGDPVRVPCEELDRFWTRQAHVAWRDHEALVDAADPLRLESWARETLSRLGYPEADLPAAVVRFQRETHLAPDGVIGSRTLMTMYALGPHPRPHLVARRASSTGGRS